MLSNVITYLVLRHEYMRANKFEKVLEIRRKKLDRAINKIELSDSIETNNLYFNSDLTIDWSRLAKHISEATSGR